MKNYLSLQSKWFVVFLLLLFSSVFFILGRYVDKIVQSASSLVDTKEIRLSAGYKFINPLLECEVSQTVGGRDYAKLEKQLSDYINKMKDSGIVSDVAVYFRDLNNGPWFGINEQADFSPASLLKLPIMMAYFKKAEGDNILLTNKINFTGEETYIDSLINQVYKPEARLEKGKKYTVEEIIERMIKYSDNVALSILEKNINNELINKITLDLGIETVTSQTPEDFMSVKSYASLFRILYNASYLNRDMSEKALSILSQSEFKDGLVAGLPASLTVAHKFGERELQNNINQLHDCGIVYYPEHPYLLCIMTRGSNIKEQGRAISNISENVFGEVNYRYKKVN